MDWALGLGRWLVLCSKFLVPKVTKSAHHRPSISEISPPSERGMLMSGYQTAL
jgi:hypothetical protein